MKNHLLSAIVSVALLGLAVPAMAAEDSYEVPTGGMQLIEKDSRGAIYADKGVDWSVYSKIMLDDATVAFRKNWERDQRSTAGSRISISPNDVERIKNNLAQEFQIVFRQTLEEGGYELVDESGEDVLLVRPAIINLDVKAPETSRAGRTITGRSPRCRACTGGAPRAR